MNSPLRWLHLQIADLISAFLAPLVGALLPAGFNKSIQWRIGRFRWLFPDRSRWIDSAEAACFDQNVALGQHWRWTMLMEACECWRLLIGLKPRLRVKGTWPETPGFLAAGMHYGVGIGALWHLREVGLKPRFVYRAVTAETLPGRPVLYLWYRLRRRLVDRLCPDGPIVIGGARRELEAAVSSGRSTPVVLIDTPTTEPTPWQLELGHCRTGIRSGVFALIADTGCRAAFFNVSTDRETGHSNLEIEMLPASGDRSTLLVKRINEVVRTDPGQWLLWPGMASLSADQNDPSE